MSGSTHALLWLRDARLAPLAVGSRPAWLWSLDGAHVLWANPVGAAMLGASDPAALPTRHFGSGHPAAMQVAQAAAALPADGAAQLRRLRGLAEFGRALTCRCVRLALSDGTAAILVASCERAGPDLPLPEQVRRLLASCLEPVAAFAPDGALIQATPAARARLGGAESLAATAETAAKADASAPLDLVRLGSETAICLIATFSPLSSASAHGCATITDSVEHSEAEKPAPAVSPPPESASADAPTKNEAAPVRAAPSRSRSTWRRPLRFVWQTDGEGRFTLTSNEFIALLGPRTAAMLGRPWDAITTELGLDPQGQFARAVATHETWSGLSVAWPVDDSPEPLVTELSGLPVFDRERTFRGYRGFGVCRDIARLAALADLRRTETEGERPAEPEPQMEVERETQTADAPANTTPAGNVVPFPTAAEGSRPSLNAIEDGAFRELARRLTTGLAANAGAGALVAPTFPDLPDTAEPDAPSADDDGDEGMAPSADACSGEQTEASSSGTGLLDQLPLGVLVYRLSHLLYANRAFLDWVGCADIEAFEQAGGLDSVLIGSDALGSQAATAPTFPVTSPRTSAPEAQARLLTVPWEGETAFALVTEMAPEDATATDNGAALIQAQRRIAELESILDTATDGIIVLDGAGRILSANRGAQVLFGYHGEELAGRPLAELLADESEPVALAYLDGLVRDGVASLINDGREVLGRVHHGGLIPLFMTIGRIEDGSDKFCAVVRDVSALKKADESPGAARRQTDEASSFDAGALTKLSHEIRTPLNSIVGFSDVMMQERFGPIGNQRYQQYLKDIHRSAGHVLSLLNEFIDLWRIEAGQIELTFTGVELNAVAQQCVAVMQLQANRERIIIRSSLSPKLPQVIADESSVRQIVLGLLSNSIKLSGPGGQVIVSTAVAEAGDVVLRVRNTGMRLSPEKLGAAEPRGRPTQTGSQAHRTGTGLGLPLAKALAEANRAAFAITSSPGVGTLVEVSFRAARMLAG